MIIGVDVDGVLTDLAKYQLVKGESYFNKPPINPYGYKLYDIFQITDEEYKRFWRENIFEYAKTYTANIGAKNVIDWIRSLGHKIYIITARSFANEQSSRGQKMREVLNNWFISNQINYDKIFYTTEDKRQIIIDNNVDIMVEDSPLNIKDLHKIVPIICIGAIYNQNMASLPNVTRVENWFDTIPHFLEFFNNKKD